MFIYHFNRMIRSKLLWLLIAILTVFAFVFADIAVKGGRDRAGARTVGTVDGKPVTGAELDRAMLFARGLNRGADVTEAQVRSNAFERIAMLRVAEKFGLKTSHDEVMDTIRASLFPDGSFNEQAYRAFVQRQFGWSPEIYEQFMGEWITLRKVGAVSDSAAWVSPMDLQCGTDALTDTYVARVVVVTNSVDAGAIEIDPEALREAYEADPSKYDQPARVQVRYVEKDLSDLVPLMEVPEGDIEDYYDEHDRDFTRWTTNNMMETLPLEDVKGEIREILARSEACYAATTNATRSFLGYVRGKSAGIFDKYVADNGYGTVVTTALFSADEAADALSGIDPEARQEFIETVFDLDAARDDSRCGVAAGGSHLYLVSAVTNYDAKTPEFDEAFTEVLADVRAAKAAEAFRAAADAEAERIRAALAEGRDFAEAAGGMAEERRLTWAKPYGLSGDEQMVLAALGRMSPGDVSDPVETSRGYEVAYLAAREPGEGFGNAAGLRSEVSAGFASERSGIFAAAWADSLKGGSAPAAAGGAPEGEGEPEGENE